MNAMLELNYCENHNHLTNDISIKYKYYINQNVLNHNDL